MRTVPQTITDAWLSPAKIGARRPVVRATIQKHTMKDFSYDTAFEYGSAMDNNRHRTGYFRSFIFGDATPIRELSNIQNCSWERTVTQDAASCTITLLNSEMVAIGQANDGDDFEKPGAFTFNRGQQTISSNRWGYDTDNGWNGVLVPDMVVKTYEGYGCDMTQPPELDPYLVQTGVWMIDKVTYSTDGSITLEMRDLARLLLDQIVFPPAVPATEYPMSWVSAHSENVPGKDCGGGQWFDQMNRFGTTSSSNDYYIGKGFTNAPYASYVGASGVVDGYSDTMPIMDHNGDDDQKIWMSTGQDTIGNFAWWQYDFANGKEKSLNALRLRMAGGPYRIYISINNGGKWLGGKKVPWKLSGVAGGTGNVDIKANIPFVKTVIADRIFEFDVILPRKYRNVKSIRITWTRLMDTGVGEHTFRAGLREMKVYAGDFSKLKFTDGFVKKQVGNYSDYTQIVKWICAWGGFYWPDHASKMDFIRARTGSDDQQWITYQNADAVLPKGRVWGDFMRSGTKGVADLTVDQFDKQPLFSVISYVRDLLGYNFWVDEQGGIVWRLPNLWSLGNYTAPVDESGQIGHRGRYGRTSEIITIDEEETLLNYTTTLDSSNIRERIFVANVVGGVGTVIKGFNPYPVGLVRVIGWTDQNFASTQETQVMADMISAQEMFSYRTATATIPGNPAIQIDDQIRIFERVTNETYYHYVQGIRSTIDMEQGEWTYDLNTHWLGENPSDAWEVRVDQLSAVTQQYLNAVGYVGSGSQDNGG